MLANCYKTSLSFSSKYQQFAHPTFTYFRELLRNNYDYFYSAYGLKIKFYWPNSSQSLAEDPPSPHGPQALVCHARRQQFSVCVTTTVRQMLPPHYTICKRNTHISTTKPGHFCPAETLQNNCGKEAILLLQTLFLESIIFIYFNTQCSFASSEENPM